ncbi:ThiF family adenylyltransferase [Candidatus Parcubacteria bacterium]|nr:ThiF family adenylyltransferase [Candidatus Parcubacteria bacterium]
MLQAPRIFRRREDLPAGVPIIDAFEPALAELFLLEHPQFRENGSAARAARSVFATQQEISPVWIYYPWRHTAVRSLPQEHYDRLRTTRNRNLITAAEQARYRQMVVGVAGLSVGSAIVSALTTSGGPQVLKIADPDTVAPSNLNRIRATLLDVGTNKTVVAARAVWELDPFARVHAWREGLDARTLNTFILGQPKLGVFIDEMDNLALKIAARHVCQRHRVPALMATDNGDGVIVDVERFDREPARPIFHGLVRGMRPQASRKLSRRQWLRLATKIIGPRFMTPRHQESLLEVGKSLAGVPQLGTTAALAGAAVAFVVRRIASGDTMSSGRYLVGLEGVFIPRYQSVQARKSRAKQTRIFVRRLFR